MYKKGYLSILAFCLILSACVTVNVYFPAAAAEKAADRFIRDIYDHEKNTHEKESMGDEAAKPGAWLVPLPAAQAVEETQLLVVLLNWVIPAASAAEPNINISSPGINNLKAAMKARHRQLLPFYSNGALGMTSKGLLQLRDANAVALKERNQVKQLLAAENRDRNQLYKEVAAANGHPEWESQIRSIFARRWIANEPGGWWFRNAQGNWQQK